MSVQNETKTWACPECGAVILLPFAATWNGSQIGVELPDSFTADIWAHLWSEHDHAQENGMDHD